MLWQAIIGGIISGLAVAFLVGPAFLALIQTNIEKGLLVGILFAIGISMSDATYFMISYLGISQLKTDSSVQKIIGGLGGLFLLGFGLNLILKRPKIGLIKAADIGRGTLFRSFLKGYLLNLLNPYVLMYWIMLVSAISAHFHSGRPMILTFFVISISVVLSTDILKSYLANKLKHLLTVRFMAYFNRISGTLLLIAGIKLLWDFVEHW